MHLASEQPPPPADLAEVFHRHRTEICHYLRVCGCDAATADDLSQDTFLVALRKKASFDTEAAARGYLRRTARLVYLEWRRRDRGEPTVADDAWLDAVDREWRRCDGHEERWLDALQRCCDQLGGRQRRAIELFYGLRHSRAEVATALGISENGVKTLLQRVRATLRACIEERLA